MQNIAASVINCFFMDIILTSPAYNSPFVYFMLFFRRCGSVTFAALSLEEVLVREFRCFVVMAVVPQQDHSLTVILGTFSHKE